MSTESTIEEYMKAHCEKKDENKDENTVEGTTNGTVDKSLLEKKEKILTNANLVLGGCQSLVQLGSNWAVKSLSRIEPQFEKYKIK